MSELISSFFNLAQASSLSDVLNHLSSLPYIIVIILFFGFCVFIHELGHFLMAKACGLYVGAFSIGFMKIWGKKWRGVEYRIGWLPFGGYVDLPQIDGSGDIPVDGEGKQLPRATPFVRLIVALAGPMANIIFGFLLAIPIWIHGIPNNFPPQDQFIVTHINQASPEYAAGLRNDDIITHIDSEPIQRMDWSSFVEHMAYYSGEVTLSIRKPDGVDSQITYRPVPNTTRLRGESVAYPFFESKILPAVKPVIDSPAAKAGLQQYDIIVAMQLEGLDKREIVERKDVVKYLSQIDGSREVWPCDIWVRRDHQVIDSPFRVYSERQNYATDLGIALTAYVAPYVTQSGNPLLQKGDVILSINQQNATKFEQIRDLLITDSADVKPLTLDVLRDSARLEVVLKPYPKKLTTDTPTAFDFVQVVKITGITPESDAEKQNIKSGAYLLNRAEILHKYPENYPIGKTVSLLVLNPDENQAKQIEVLPSTLYLIGVDFFGTRHQTPWKQFTHTCKSTWKMLSGMVDRQSNISVKNMSGPIGIINVVHKVAQVSIWSAISLIVVISFSLGLFNLFPIPILDGGHIMFSLFEIIVRRPIPSSIMRPIMYTFFVLLIGLMLGVTVLDGFRVSKNYEASPSDPFTTPLILPDNGSN